MFYLCILCSRSFIILQTWCQTPACRQDKYNERRGGRGKRRKQRGRMGTATVVWCTRDELTTGDPTNGRRFRRERKKKTNEFSENFQLSVHVYLYLFFKNQVISVDFVSIQNVHFKTISSSSSVIVNKGEVFQYLETGGWFKWNFPVIIFSYNLLTQKNVM